MWINRERRRKGEEFTVLKVEDNLLRNEAGSNKVIYCDGMDYVSFLSYTLVKNSFIVAPNFKDLTLDL